MAFAKISRVVVCEVIVSNLKKTIINKRLCNRRVFFFVINIEKKKGLTSLKIQKPLMKKITLLIFSVFISLSGWAQFPDIEAKDIDQNWVSLKDFKGEKLTVIDFWATWCKPCVAAIPKLNSIYGDFSEKGVGFIGVNVDGPRNLSKVKPFATSMNIKYPMVLDPDQDLVNRFNVTVFPTLIVLNEKGKEVFVHEGFNQGDEKLIREKLQKLLN